MSLPARDPVQDAPETTDEGATTSSEPVRTLTLLPVPAPVAPSPIPPPPAVPPAQAPRRQRGGAGKRIGAIAASIVLLGAVLVGIGTLVNRGAKRQTSEQPGVAGTVQPGQGGVATTAPSGQAEALPPAAPTGFAVGRVTTTSVRLSWDRPTTPVDRYVVYRDDAFLDSTSGAVFSYTDEEVALGTTYRYQVAATGAGRMSEFSPAVQAHVKMPRLSAAHLAGSYDIKLRLTSESGFTSLSSGKRYSEYWSITRRSTSRVTVLGESPGGGWTIKLIRHGTVYRGQGRATLSACSGLPVRDTITLAIRIVKAHVVDGVWQATRFEGTLTDTAPYTSMGLSYCPSASYTAHVVGT